MKKDKSASTLEVMINAKLIYKFGWEMLLNREGGDEARAVHFAMNMAEIMFEKGCGVGNIRIFEHETVSAVRDECNRDGDCQSWTVFPEDRSA